MKSTYFGVLVVFVLGILALMGAGLKPIPAFIATVMIGEILIQGIRRLYRASSPW
jgi:hypothetical protein